MNTKTLLAIMAIATLAVVGIGCGDDDGTDPGMDAGDTDAGVDAGEEDSSTPVPGCVASAASNYDPEATVDDGSCVFTVSFAVDMTAYTYERSDGLTLEGSFCTDDCPALQDDDEDEVWEGSAELAAGSYTYRFVIGAETPEVETVPSYCLSDDTSRGFVVETAPVDLDPVAFGGCTVLPLVVDGFYAAGGYFGDTEGIAVEETCPERGGDGAGACRTWTYTRGDLAYAGVFWQYPESNWGETAGFPIPRGATRVSFSAWGASGSEVVKFLVGYGPDDSGDRDGFALEQELTLTTTPTDYTFSLVGVDYDEVAAGFGWVASLEEGAGPLTFYVDDIVWERVPADLESVPGCTDADASNYDAAATTDDGSCVYAVTFSVDMNCPDPSDAFTTVSITGPFCSWCNAGYELSDGDADGVYTGTFDFPAGALEFKFMTDGFASQENLVDDVVGGGTCAPITDAASYANRQITVDTAPTSVSAAYGRCETCS